MSKTPYDDAFKTLINGPELIVISFINEIFHTNHPYDSRIYTLANESLSPESGNRLKKIISDSVILIEENDKEICYHMECQSYADDQILIRMAQYDLQIALHRFSYEDASLKLQLPESAVLFLRNGPKHKEMNVTFVKGEGSFSYPIRTVSISDYDIDTIIERRLFFLIPFSIFLYDAKIKQIDRDPEKRKKMARELNRLFKFLNAEALQGKVSSYTYKTIIEMSRMVFQAYTMRYNKIRKEVFETMGGEIIQYQARIDYHEGYAQGWKESIAEFRKKGFTEGVLEGGKQILDELAKTGRLDQEEADQIFEDLQRSYMCS